MHELSIVTHVMKTLREVAEENHLHAIGSVTLSVGEVSGIVREQMLDCWDWFKKRDELMKDAVLQLETIPALTYCSSCGRQYPTIEYGKTCPFCGSKETWLLQGNEFSIKEIEAE